MLKIGKNFPKFKIIVENYRKLLENSLKMGNKSKKFLKNNEKIDESGPEL